MTNLFCCWSSRSSYSRIGSQDDPRLFVDSAGHLTVIFFASALAALVGWAGFSSLFVGSPREHDLRMIMNILFAMSLTAIVIVSAAWIISCCRFHRERQNADLENPEV